MGKRKAKIGFQFAGNYHSGIVEMDRSGKTTCDICRGRFACPEIQVSIWDFLICPSCLHAGPSAVAAAAEAIAGDEGRIARMWEYSPESERKDIAGMARLYRRFASALRKITSFDELPGGKTALGVANLLGNPKGPGSSRAGKAA